MPIRWSPAWIGRRMIWTKYAGQSLVCFVTVMSFCSFSIASTNITVINCASICDSTFSCVFQTNWWNGWQPKKHMGWASPNPGGEVRPKKTLKCFLASPGVPNTFPHFFPGKPMATQVERPCWMWPLPCRCCWPRWLRLRISWSRSQKSHGWWRCRTRRTWRSSTALSKGWTGATPPTSTRLKMAEKMLLLGASC